MLHEKVGVKVWAMTGITGFLILLILIWKMGRQPIPVAVVDMTRAIQAPSLMLARSKLSQKTQLKFMSRFSILLPKVIKEYGQTHSLAVVNATVLASFNPVDVTNEIITLTIARVKHEG